MNKLKNLWDIAWSNHFRFIFIRSFSSCFILFCSFFIISLCKYSILSCRPQTSRYLSLSFFQSDRCSLSSQGFWQSLWAASWNKYPPEHTEKPWALSSLKFSEAQTFQIRWLEFEAILGKKMGLGLSPSLFHRLGGGLFWLSIQMLT